MTPRRLLLAMCLALAVGFVPTGAAAQPPDAPAAPPAGRGSSSAPPERPGRGASAQVPDAPPPPSVDIDDTRFYRSAVRVGSSYALAAGGDAADVVVIMGDATIDGHVHGDVAVVMGDLQLGPAAIVEGSIAVVGGSATAAEGASVRDEFVIVGGTLNAPSGFLPEGEHVIVGNPHIGAAMRSFTPWVTRGLLWGRVIVPSVGWIWWLVAISALIYLAIAVLFPGAVAATTQVIVSRPLSAFFAGLLTLLLVGPISTILAISVVGIVVIPFIFFAVLIGSLVGKVAVFSWIGSSLVRPPAEEGVRPRVVLPALIGLVLVTVLYMVPVVGLMTWAVVGMLGLGASAMTFFKAMRRERSVKTPPPVVPPPVVPPPAPPAPTGGPSGSGGTDGTIGTPAIAFSATDPGSSSSLGYQPTPEPPIIGLPSGGGPAAVVAGDLAAYPRASFLDRVAAGALDALLVAVAVNMLDIDRYGHYLLWLLLYHIGFWAWKGTTVGGIVCNLRVIRIDGGPVRPVDAVVRGLASLFSFAALGIGFFWILLESNRERQAWHDIIAGTFVVRVPRNLPLP
jgi:uncharacterized RDD family membrane protein YckC